MILWTGVVFVLLFFLIPFGIGNVLVRSKSFSLTMIGGLFFSFCVFEILSLIFHVTMGSLRLQVALWCVVCIVIALIGWRKAGRGERPKLKKEETWTQTEKILLLVAVALIVLQTMNTVLNVYYGNWDDETYCGTAVTSWYTDTVDRYAPGIGVKREAFYSEYYNIATWPVYSSMLAVLTGLHPAIIFRTVLPLFEIPFTYYIVYLLIRVFWKDCRAKALLSLIYFQLFTLLTAEHMPQTSSEWWSVVNCWTGKALMSSIMTPLILWLMIQLEENQKVKTSTDAIWRALFFVCWAGCFISASLFFVIPLELALWGGFYLLRTKRWKDFTKLVVCVLPALTCAAVTYF